jgi:RimJ/RimL family protein N-acetyltransferase
VDVIETPRLRLRPLTPADAPFIFELLNDPGWIRFIGDRNIRTLEDARAYIEQKVLAMYAKHGVGSLCVESKESGEALGICGLIRREGLDDVDIGFAFLPRHRAKGYAFEAASAAIEHGRRALGVKRVVAINSRDNESSARLLEKLGLRYVSDVKLPHSDEELRLYAT